MAAESAAFNVKPSPSEPNNSAALLHLKASRYARRTAGEAPALKPKLADYVALKLKPFTAMKRAKRDPIGLKLWVGLGRWRT